MGKKKSVAREETKMPMPAPVEVPKRNLANKSLRADVDEETYQMVWELTKNLGCTFSAYLKALVDSDLKARGLLGNKSSSRPRRGDN